MMTGMVRSPVKCLIALACAALMAAPAYAGSGGSSSDNTQRRRVTTSDYYIHVPGLTATVTEDYRARGVLHVDAGFDIPDDDLRARAEAWMPRLRAACADALMRYAGRQYRSGDVPDAERIAALLQAAAEEALGEPGARAVLTMVIVHAGR